MLISISCCLLHQVYAVSRFQIYYFCGKSCFCSNKNRLDPERHCSSYISQQDSIPVGCQPPTCFIMNKFEHERGPVQWGPSWTSSNMSGWGGGGSLHSEVQWFMGNAHMGPPVELQTRLKTLPSSMECRAVYWLCIRSTLSAKLINFLICFYVYFQFWKFHERSFSSQGKFTAFYKITKKSGKYQQIFGQSGKIGSVNTL